MSPVALTCVAVLLRLLLPDLDGRAERQELYPREGKVGRSRDCNQDFLFWNWEWSIRRKSMRNEKGLSMPTSL
jgi:hypothetical protein